MQGAFRGALCCFPRCSPAALVIEDCSAVLSSSRWTPPLPATIMPIAFARFAASGHAALPVAGIARGWCVRHVGQKLNPSFLEALRSLFGDGLITSPDELRTYECDGLTNFRVAPLAVVLPTTAEQGQAIVRLCAPHRGD